MSDDEIEEGSTNFWADIGRPDANERLAEAQRLRAERKAVGLPSTERLNALGAHALRGVIWQHRAGGVRIVGGADAGGRVIYLDPWETLLPAVAQLSETIGPLPAEDEAARDQAREALARLVSQAERIVRESGDPTGYNAGQQWAGAFLVTPHPSLGGRRPADLMHTAEGQQQVLDLVGRMQSSAYS